MSGYNDDRAFAPQLGYGPRRPAYSRTIGAEGSGIWDDVGANAGSVIGNLLNTSLNALESSGQRSIQQAIDPASMSPVQRVTANFQQNKWLYLGIGAVVVIGLMMALKKK